MSRIVYPVYRRMVGLRLYLRADSILGMTLRKAAAPSPDRCRCSCGCKRMGAKMKTVEGKTYRLLLCGPCMQTHQKSPKVPF